MKLRLLGVSVFFFLLSLSLVSQSTLSIIKARGELKVGLTATQPPYAMMANDSTIIGFEIDIAQKIADKMGLKLKLVKLNFSDLITALTEGEIDVIMSGLTITAERNMEIAFVGPYHSSGMSILTFAQVYADAESPEDLNKGSVKIAALKGSTSEAYVKEYMPKAKLISAENYEDAIELLNKDKAGLLLSGNAIIRYTMFRNPDSGYVTLEEAFNYEPIGLGVMPNDYLLVNLLQNIINEMRENGELESLENYWFWDDEWIEKLN